jgi:pyruvate formate lyase activating enzyme
MVAEAIRRGAASISSTYNEPLISIEWALEIFREARAGGLLTSFVSNGHATPEAVEALAPWLDCINIDLKGFTDEFYNELGGHLQPVLDTIAACSEAGIWTEVVTLVVPGRNDSPGELSATASFLAGISPDIPWHVTAYHPDYHYTEPGPTPPATLERAVEIGRSSGLNHVYAGNRPGRMGALESTRCQACGVIVIERYGFRIVRNDLENGSCPSCGTPIAGRWNRQSP